MYPRRKSTDHPSGKMGISTSLAIKALKAKTSRYDVAVDSEGDDGRSLPGLQLRVFPSGAKVFQYRYAHNKETRRMTIGPADAVSLTLARERHAAAVKLLGRGIDPQDHQAEVAAAAVREKAKAAAQITLDLLVDEFIIDKLRKHRRDPAQAERLLRADVVPKWTGRKIHELRKRDAYELVKKIKKRAPVLANRVASLIVQLFEFAVAAGHLTENPMAGLKRPTEEQPRERMLSVKEIQTLWTQLDGRSSGQPRGNLKKGSAVKRGSVEDPWISRPLALAVKLLLVTGQRRGELMLAARDEFDFDKSTWLIPAARSKNGKPHVVPLSPLAIELLEELQANTPKGSRYLFPTAHSVRRGDKPSTDKALTRAVARNQCGLAHWTPHDLRRTAASHMNRIGVDVIVVEKVLNHSLPKMMKVYNRHDYEQEKRDALDKWAAEIQAVIAGKSNVVALPERKASA